MCGCGGSRGRTAGLLSSRCRKRYFSLTFCLCFYRLSPFEISRFEISPSEILLLYLRKIVVAVGFFCFCFLILISKRMPVVLMDGPRLAPGTTAPARPTNAHFMQAGRTRMGTECVWVLELPSVGHFNSAQRKQIYRRKVVVGLSPLSWSGRPELGAQRNQNPGEPGAKSL